ncbi:hypothetical protein [Streptomyces aureocirculatus]|uniref:hypothetical protein n=1 Tax=Streptomyces aureocirculatus TaxID=67275 RepID=UPI000A4A4189|nr:hypothetical protein [Streptomyces aureocirculatus]
MSDLYASIQRVLEGTPGVYDIDALADALRGMGATTVDDVPAEEFWDLVSAHELPELPVEPGPLDRFRAELSQAWAEAPAGSPAVWQRGGVTLESVGVSRVNFALPQTLATHRVSVAGLLPVTELTPDQVSSWSRLWATVEALLADWSRAVADQRLTHEQAVARARAARAAAEAAAAAERGARTRLAELLDAPALSTTMSRDEVADYLGIAPGSVSKQMRRWGISSEGPGGPRAARYPTAEVQAHAAKRLGRGHRSDLD